MYLSDFAFTGSGYLQISTPLCKGLVDNGYEVFVVGLNYTGQEHNFPFKIIPCRTFDEARAMITNLYQTDFENIKTLIVALDVPQQIMFLDLKTKFPELKYVCITPLENPPLTFSWAAPLMDADGVFFISEMGAQAARDAGVSHAEHIQIGVDENWKPPTEEERERMRKSMGVEDKFVILSVADNQERKNLWAALEMVAKLKQEGISNLKFFLITREHLQFGWRLRDLGTELGINEELSIVERGIPFEQLWMYYCIADVYLNTSKAEGLGYPLLEAMATKTPVLASETGAMPELLEDGRGYTIPIEYSFRDVWGNEERDMVDVEAGAKLLRKLMEEDLSPVTEKAYEYVKSRTWDIPVKQLTDKLEEIYGTNKEHEAD